MKEKYKKLPLRSGVGIVLLNKENKIFVAKRIDNPKNFWQMPQGGIDKGEDFYTAAVRELKEELTLFSTESTILNNLTEVGIIYTPLDGLEDSDKRKTTSIPPVGAVHLGDIYMLEVPHNVTIKDNEGMINPQFLDVSEAYKSLDKYETWSRLILETLAELKEFN